MHSNTRPVASPVESGPLQADLGALLTPELAPAVASARRRASRDGDRQVDTAHLLHSLLETDALVRAAFESAQLARVLGYLVQRSIGFGLQWQASVESSRELPVIPQQTAPPGVSDPVAQARPQERWSPAVETALHTASSIARTRGQERADGADLLVAITADPENRAVDVLRSAGVDIERTVAGLRH